MVNVCHILVFMIQHTPSKRWANIRHPNGMVAIQTKYCIYSLSVKVSLHALATHIHSKDIGKTKCLNGKTIEQSGMIFSIWFNIDWKPFFVLASISRLKLEFWSVVEHVCSISITLLNWQRANVFHVHIMLHQPRETERERENIYCLDILRLSMIPYFTTFHAGVCVCVFFSGLANATT